MVCFGLFFFQFCFSFSLVWSFLVCFFCFLKFLVCFDGSPDNWSISGQNRPKNLHIGQVTSQPSPHEMEKQRGYLEKKREKATERMETLRRLHKRHAEEVRSASQEIDEAQHKYDQAIILRGEIEVEQEAARKRLRKALNDKFSTEIELGRHIEMLNDLPVRPTTSPQGCEPAGDQCEATGGPTTGSPVAPTTTGSTLPGTRSHSTGVDPVDQVEEYKNLEEEAVLRRELLFRKKKEQDEEHAIAKEELCKAYDRNVKAKVRQKEAEAATHATEEEIFDLTEKINEYRAKLGS